MSESVIFNSPLLIVGFAAALALCLFAIVKKTGFAVTLLAAAMFVALSTYALLLGASLEEVGLAAIVFFSVNAFAAWRGRGNK